MAAGLVQPAPASPPSGPVTSASIELAPTAIGFLRQTFLGRSETFIYESMRGLASTGRYRVRVLTLRREHAERFPWDDVTELRGLARVACLALRTSPAFVRWARSVRLIHAHLGQVGPLAMAGAARAGVPFVVSYYGHDVVLHGSRERYQAWAWWYVLLRRRMLRRAARVIVLSDHMRRALIAQGCPEHKLAVVRLGIDVARFAGERPPYEGPLRVLMIGREVDKKGFDDGLRACRALRERGVPCRVTVLGTGGPLKAELVRLGDDLGLDVAWPEPASPVPEALAAADVLLVPSRRAASGDEEGTPTVILEGGAAGLPVVSTRHAGIPEQIVDGETGLLADERGVPALAAALERLAADPGLRERLGRAARRKVEAEYSHAAHTAALTRLYDDVLQEASR